MLDIINHFFIRYGFIVMGVAVIVATISFVLAMKELIEFIREERNNGKKR